MKREELEQLAEPITFHKWGIIGPYGNIWTTDLFDKPEHAEDHLRRFWGRNGFSGYHAAPVEVTVRELTSAEMPRVELVDRTFLRSKDPTP